MATGESAVPTCPGVSGAGQPVTHFRVAVMGCRPVLSRATADELRVAREAESKEGPADGAGPSSLVRAELA